MAYNIYQTWAVCLDSTWNALSTEEQDLYDGHSVDWDTWVARSRDPLSTNSLGCLKVVVWNDYTMPLPTFNPYPVFDEDEDNFVIIEAHETAKHYGEVGVGIRFLGFGTYSNYTEWRYIEFDNDDNPGVSTFDCYNKNHKFLDCLFLNISASGCGRLRTVQWFKNCLFLNFATYMTFNAGVTKLINCGFYSNVASTNMRACYAAVCYNCWAHRENCTAGYSMFYACTGKNNYATDGSEPIETRTISSFGFGDVTNMDFSITASSPLFDLGATSSDLPVLDIEGKLRNQGVSPDVGPFEVVVVSSRTFKMTGIPTGAEVRIYEASTTAGVIGTVELSGIESWTGGDYTYTYTYTADVDIAVQIIASGYTESVKYYTLENSSQTIPIVLEAEENL